jgi:hypothetical protein
MRELQLVVILIVTMLLGEDVSLKKDGGVLKSRLKDGSGNPPKDGAVCESKRFRCARQCSILLAIWNCTVS